MQFPEMATVRQHFQAVAETDVPARVRSELEGAGLRESIAPGARIAVSTGSRGIANIDAIIRAVVQCVTDAGGRPFILPAMGSHGGATAEGQKQVLAEYGISPATMGVDVESTMEVVEVDRLEDGTPVLVNRLALESDGVILVNRIKPHTSFRGPCESGLMKMMTIGLGSHRGATVAHSRGVHGLATLIPAWGRSILAKAPILMGLAVIENAYEQTGRLVALRRDDIPRREPELLVEAREAMPRLLVRGIDLLIIEEIGKDISGTGMDTNVVGRMMLPGVKEPEVPGVGRIVVLDLSERTNGNANGMGLADIVTRRLVDRVDHKATYANAFTSTYLNRAYIPVIMETDREAIAAALQVAGLEDAASARIVRIRNTLALASIQVSTPLLAEFASHPQIEQVGEPQPLTFSSEGQLI